MPTSTNGLAAHPRIPVRGEEGALAARAATIVELLGKGLASAEEVFAAFEELDALPPDLVRAALSSWTGPAPDPEQLDAATRAAHGFPPRSLHLRTVAVVRDADVLDVGSVAEEQLRVAGKTWDGRDLPAEARLDGEDEESFAGTLERRVLAEVGPDGETGAPLFDVFLFAGDSGVVFRAGTTDVVGAVAYGTVEMKDRRARVAIQAALSEPVAPKEMLASSDERAQPGEDASKQAARVLEEAPTKAAAKETGRAAKAASKKAAAKNVASKKVASNEAAPKKAAAKRATPKTAAVEKPAAKKVGATKAAAKKASAPKTDRKKTAPTKTSSKKVASKKVASKKATSKKATSKKATSKKATSKKATSKKAAPKKPASKKPSKKAAGVRRGSSPEE